MLSLEKRVKHFTCFMLGCGIIAVCVVLYMSGLYMLKKEKTYYLSTARNKIYNIESYVNDYLNTYTNILDYIKNDKQFIELYSNTATGTIDENICLIRTMKKNKHIQSIGFIDINGKFGFKFEKDIYNILLTSTIDEIQKGFHAKYIKEVKKTKKIIFSSIYSSTIFQNPVVSAYNPIFNKHNEMIGVLFSVFDISIFLNQTINYDIFDVILYDSTSKIYFNSCESKAVGITDSSLFDRYYDYKNMLTTDIYNNNDTVSKMLHTDIAIYGGLGIQLIFNKDFKQQLVDGIFNIFIIYAVSLLIFLIFVAYIIKQYISDSIAYDNLQKYSTWLEVKNKQLNENMLIDTLTGLGNREYYKKKITELYSMFLRHKQPFSLIIFVVNGLREIRETYGLFYEEDLIKIISDSIRVFIRDSDIFIRIDNNKFVILLPNTDEEFAEKFTVKIMNYCKNINCEMGDNEAKLSILCSSGTIDEKDSDPYMLYKRVNSKLKNTEIFINKTCSI